MELTDWFGLISAISLVVVMVLSLYDWYYKRRAGALKHSIDLYKALIKANYEVNFNFDYANEDLKLNPEIKTNGLHNEFKEIDYSEEIKSHLKDNAYKNMCDIIKRKNIYIELHNLESQEFLKDLNLKIMATIPNMELWDELGVQPIKYYTNHLLKQIKDIVLWYYTHPLSKERMSNEFIIKPSNNQWILYRSYNLIGNDNKEELEEINQQIIKILIGSLESPKFSLLKVYFGIIKTRCHSKLTKEIIQIKKDMNSNKPIKGKCSQCP